MDSALNDAHSDSDSGESWTLLEAGPSFAATPSPCPSPAVSAAAGDRLDGADKDEDTDGISIISDSESESIAACEPVGSEGITPEQPTQQAHCPTDSTLPNVQAIPQATNINNNFNESTRLDHFLSDSTVKLKTYVHRRNKKVSSMLNVILLGSVITAAGVALGHMWGAREDCSLKNASSVNKVLSNLYRLQEENAFLRSKLKELTAASSFQLQKNNYEKSASVKQNKCRKMYEEPLHNSNVVKTTKCLELGTDFPKENPGFRNNDLILTFATGESEFDSGVNRAEFKNDVKKLKQIYKDNQHWLDDEIARRFKEQETIAVKHSIKLKLEKDKPQEEQYDSKHDKVTVKLQISDYIEPTEKNMIGSKPLPNELKEPNPDKIISYAESVKSRKLNKNQNDDSIKKMEDLEVKTNRLEKRKYKRKLDKRDAEEFSDDDYKSSKDNRYSANKQKNEKPKLDRQKPYKRQKRENKYEQWEMKGGYLKNFDSVSTLSSEDNAKPQDGYDKNRLSQEWERVNYMDQFSEVENNLIDKAKSAKAATQKSCELNTRSKRVGNSAGNTKQTKTNKSMDSSLESDWFEKRSVFRKQARANLEADILRNGKMKSNARWYFRRMNEREQCRVRADHTNTTKRKVPKRSPNFKNRR